MAIDPHDGKVAVVAAKGKGPKAGLEIHARWPRTRALGANIHAAPPETSPSQPACNMGEQQPEDLWLFGYG